MRSRRIASMPRPAWSPDGTRISYTERSREFFSGKLKVLPFDQKTGKPASGPALDIYVAKNDPGGAWASQHGGVVARQQHARRGFAGDALGQDLVDSQRAAESRRS
jgi:hypothetical protein